MVHCIFRSHRLKIDEKFKTILVCCGVWYVASHSGPLPKFSNYAQGVKEMPILRATCFTKDYIGET